MLTKINKLFPKANDGGILIVTLTFVTVFLVFGVSLLSLINQQQKLYRANKAKALALHIAEAGLNYYRWHLAHEPEDYADGTGETDCNPCGPYVHDFEDIGQFSIEITPPQTGSTIVKIKSTGWVNEYPNTKRMVVARYGIPSLAQYSFLTHSNVWFGENETVVGPMHSNGGIRMDGSNNSVITSAKETYICGPEHGCAWGGEEKPGIWGSGSGSDLWQFPVTTVDFNAITADLAQIKADAESGGVCFGDGTPDCNTGGTSNYGFHITFKSDGTFDLYRVTRLYSCQWQLNEDWNRWQCIREQIRNETAVGNYPIPENGMIFVEGNLWVDGIVNGKVTVAAAKLPGNPNTYKDIRINGNLTYLARDGNHNLGLIAQDNIWVPRYAPCNLTIDSVLVAQNGRVARNYYWYHRICDQIETYGSIITNKIWTWTWVTYGGTVVDGYRNTVFIYDPDLKYSPPPSFPTTGEYEFISWEEILPEESY
jgi:hypothetical protein